MPTATVIRYHQYGDPSAVLQVEPMPVPAPAAGEVGLRLIMAAINPSDVGQIQGRYGRLPRLPTVAGREAVAEVVAVGDEVVDYQLGERVLWPAGYGAWQAYAVVPAKALLVKVPPEISNELAAMASINPPTAWRLLHDFTQLQPGDWVIQNAANSVVGTFVIQFAHFLGIRTINVVRQAELQRSTLLALGADIVVEDNDDYLDQIDAWTAGCRPKLAFNSVGGRSVLRLVKAVAEQGGVVTFGGMVGEPIRFPTRDLIFRNVKLWGFGLDQWCRSHGLTKVAALYAALWPHLAKMQCPTIAAVYDLKDVRQAVAHAMQASRGGKVLIRGEE